MRVAGHPLHAALSHFPLALLAAVPVWDVLAVVHGQAWWTVGYGCLALGLIASFAAAMTGAVDFTALPEDARVLRIAVRHVTFVLMAVAMGVAGLILRGGIAPPEAAHRVPVMVLSFLTLVPLVAGGWYGAELVFGHGIGIRRSHDETSTDASDTP